MSKAIVIIDTRSTAAKKMLEYLKATRYACIVEEDISNDETISAIKDVEKGKVKSYNSAKEMMSVLKKKTGVIQLPKKEEKNKKFLKQLKGAISSSRAEELIEIIDKERSGN